MQPLPKMHLRTITLSIIIMSVYCSAANAVQNMESYPELGLIIGGALQPSVGYWWGKKGLRLSGIRSGGKKKEFHLNLGYTLSESKNSHRSINLITSRIIGNDPGADYNYAATGIAYGLNYKGFFIELGLGWPWRDDIGNLANRSVIPVGYWGYIYRFGQKKIKKPFQKRMATQIDFSNRCTIRW